MTNAHRASLVKVSLFYRASLIRHKSHFRSALLSIENAHVLISHVYLTPVIVTLPTLSNCMTLSWCTYVYTYIYTGFASLPPHDMTARRFIGTYVPDRRRYRKTLRVVTRVVHVGLIPRVRSRQVPPIFRDLSSSCDVWHKSRFRFQFITGRALRAERERRV